MLKHADKNRRRQRKSCVNIRRGHLAIHNGLLTAVTVVCPSGNIPLGAYNRKNPHYPDVQLATILVSSKSVVKP
jgi:hypothetical protein